MTIATKTREQITQPGQVAKIIQAVMKTEEENDRKKEHLWSIGLDRGGRIIYIEMVSMGTLGETLMHPRETYRMAILKQATSIIICHNHPSGDLMPSDQDRTRTRELQKAGEIIGITMNDHIVITENGYVSMKEWGII